MDQGGAAVPASRLEAARVILPGIATADLRAAVFAIAVAQIPAVPDGIADSSNQCVGE